MSIHLLLIEICPCMAYYSCQRSLPSPTTQAPPSPSHRQASSQSYGLSYSSRVRSSFSSHCVLARSSLTSLAVSRPQDWQARTQGDCVPRQHLLAFFCPLTIISSQLNSTQKQRRTGTKRGPRLSLPRTSLIRLIPLLYLPPLLPLLLFKVLHLLPLNPCVNSILNQRKRPYLLDRKSVV